MKISEHAKDVIDIIQWILIILSIGACFYIYSSKNDYDEKSITQVQNDRYIRIYDSQRIESLKKENEELYDSIKKLNNVESAIQIKYVYKYKIDTVYVLKYETMADSTYHYTYDNDTLKYDLDIKASNLKWHKSNFELHDKFTIINEMDKGGVTTTIEHSPNTTIEDMTAWRKKNSFKDNIYYGPTIGVGYGIFNKKIDTYVGFSIGCRFGN